MYTVRYLQLPVMQEVYMEDLAVVLVVEVLHKVQDLEVPPSPDRVLDQHLGEYWDSKFLNIFDYFFMCHSIVCKSIYRYKFRTVLVIVL